MRGGASSYPIPTSPSGEWTIYRGGSPLLTRHRRLCSILERLAGGDERARSVFHGMPWLTPILGTGLLELGDGPSIDLGAIGSLTRRVIDELNIDVPRELGDIGSIAQSFAEAMCRGRTHDTISPARGPQFTPSDEAGTLMIITALLTRLFHGALMSAPSPSSRWWTKEHAELSGSTSIEVYLRESVLPPLLDLLEAVTASSSDDGSTNSDIARQALLQKIFDGLRGRPPVLGVEDLRLITEMTWLKLLENTSIYPGWSELLLQLLVNYSEVASSAPAGRRPKVVQLEELGKEVSSLLARPTNRSWSSRLNGCGPNERDSFYSAIARLLHAQAKVFALLHSPSTLSLEEDDAHPDVEARYLRSVAIRGRIGTDTKRKRVFEGRSLPSVTIPHPVAFVTSFDLEIEMALWAIGLPFRVVLPVLCTSSRRSIEADLVWLVATIDPTMEAVDPSIEQDNDELKGHPLLSCSHDWRIAQAIFRPEEGGDLPVIVRLSGSPLMTLPDLIGDLREDFRGLGYEGEEKVKPYHALTIDEYTSLRQSENELFFAAREEARGLPSCLAGGTDSNERVWIGLGVQIDDPAIRARMFSQLSAGSLQHRTQVHARMEEWDRAHGETDSSRNNESHSDEAIWNERVAVRGLAVNKRIDEDEATALYWLGFQFALDLNCSSLTEDIEHCTEHIVQVKEQASALVPQSSNENDEHFSDVNWQRASNSSCSLWSSCH